MTNKSLSGELKHTALPWKVRKHDPSYPNEAFIDIPYGYIQIGGSQSRRDGNAEFIVKCVNSHYELLEACKRGLERVKQLTKYSGHKLLFSFETIEILEQAIAKAEVKS